MNPTRKEEALYGQTIAYLEERGADGRDVFRRFRESRVLLSGTGESFRTLVRALLEMGLRAPLIVEPDDKELTRLLNEWKEQDGELELTRVAFGRATRWMRAQTELPVLVVHVCDKYKEAAVNDLTETCAELNVPVLIGSQLLDGLEPPAELTEEADSPEFQRMIGKAAALEALKSLTGMPSLK